VVSRRETVLAVALSEGCARVYVPTPGRADDDLITVRGRARDDSADYDKSTLTRGIHMFCSTFGDFLGNLRHIILSCLLHFT